jgi:glycosyltransferase involved in cell wall biosynthesis
VVNTATPQAIARAVHYLVKNPEMRLQIGQAGRRTIQQHFSVERQMRQYEQFYKELAVRK